MAEKSRQQQPEVTLSLQSEEESDECTLILGYNALHYFNRVWFGNILEDLEVSHSKSISIMKHLVSTCQNGLLNKSINNYMKSSKLFTNEMQVNTTVSDHNTLHYYKK